MIACGGELSLELLLSGLLKINMVFWLDTGKSS